MAQRAGKPVKSPEKKADSSPKIDKNSGKKKKIAVKTVAQPQKSGKNITKPITKSRKIATPETNPNHYSISALAREFTLDRATVRARIEEAGIEPVSSKAKEKLYLLDDRLDACLAQKKMNDVKIRKLDTEAALKALELEIKRGNYVAVGEVIDVIQKIFSKMRKNIVVSLPGRIATRLHNAKSSAETKEILKRDLEKEFEAVRDDFPKYLGEQ